MKNFLKKYWVLCAFGALVLVAGLVVGVLVLRSTPTKAVEGYIRASLEYDAEKLVKYASDYQVTAMSFADIDRDQLLENLQKSYELAAEYRENGKIKFDSKVTEEIEKGTPRFAELLDEYGFKADPETVDEFAIVEGVYYVDGKLRDDFKVAAVKCGMKWYYGFLVY
ncbi:MAG: hypothetical protein IJD82_09565 [Clostridia bacterium]|nr:hypothetical protein [Clostridia bacterium]